TFLAKGRGSPSAPPRSFSRYGRRSSSLPWVPWNDQSVPISRQSRDKAGRGATPRISPNVTPQDSPRRRSTRAPNCRLPADRASLARQAGRMPPETLRTRVVDDCGDLHPLNAGRGPVQISHLLPQLVGEEAFCSLPGVPDVKVRHPLLLLIE